MSMVKEQAHIYEYHLEDAYAANTNNLKESMSHIMNSSNSSLAGSIS